MEDLGQSALSAGANISLWSLFIQAHLIVKIVMIGLILASVWCWAIMIDKTILYRRAKGQMDRFEQIFWSGQSLEELYRTLSQRNNSGSAGLFVTAMREWKRTYEGGARSIGGLQMRLDKVMDVAIAQQTERWERRLLILATVGSAGPFIGLFGTVWGIMTSFQAIAAAQTTNLAVVAVLPRRFWPRLLACWRRFQRLSPIINSAANWAA